MLCGPQRIHVSTEPVEGAAHKPRTHGWQVAGCGESGNAADTLLITSRCQHIK